MPICLKCRSHVSSKDLSVCNDQIMCRMCIKRSREKVKIMNEKKMVLNLNISEVPAEDGATDHSVTAAVNWNGLTLSYETTFDQVRTFFTKKREKGKPAKLLPDLNKVLLRSVTEELNGPT